MKMLIFVILIIAVSGFVIYIFRSMSSSNKCKYDNLIEAEKKRQIKTSKNLSGKTLINTT